MLINPLTATSTIAASTTFGRLLSIPVRYMRHRPIVTEANTSASGVLAPALSFTEDCDRPPATGYAWKNAAARFAAPRPSSSWRGSIS